MPARRFAPERLLLTRREARLKQADVADGVGVTAARVSAWETGRSVPDPEKFPSLARVLDCGLDELFPREGAPDLADLRADAGYSQTATKDLTGTRSAGPVAAAETGQRRLAEEYRAPLAAAYGVSVEQLLRAQERSFGIDVPEPGDGERAGLDDPLPETLAEKITYLLGRLSEDLSDQQVAARGNVRAGVEVLNAHLVYELRTGRVTHASQDVLSALAEALDTTPVIWSQDADVQRILSETMLLSGQIAAIAARGGEQKGLSADLLDFILHEVDKARVETQDGEGPTGRR
ncbi:DNA-binding protein [Streptomyces populi]|uniref:DNA-binding protein n=1 Tax=Streptomyces populi TaxID=2058924 RepID=A0A2I0SDB0_9ACTN|nr:helix-turn-helix transcriptional regulator [Streptomyces populi]PKT67896.1 DNA-binding protein [Streptomyces populi]